MTNADHTDSEIIQMNKIVWKKKSLNPLLQGQYELNHWSLAKDNLKFSRMKQWE